MKVLYTTTIINTGGRNGHASSPDGKFAVDVVQPKELTGKDTDATNPEQLFAAAYSSCFHGALESVLRKARAQYEGSKVAAAVHLLEDPADGGWKLGVDITASIKGMSLEEASKFVALAHTVCPYSKATRGNVEVKLAVE